MSHGLDRRYEVGWADFGVVQTIGEGKDYCTFLSNRSDGFPGKQAIDHALSISMAKELCMLQRSETGKEFRRYFLSIEEEWNSPDKIMERALQIAHDRALEAERRIFEENKNA